MYQILPFSKRSATIWIDRDFGYQNLIFGMELQRISSILIQSSYQ